MSLAPDSDVVSLPDPVETTIINNEHIPHWLQEIGLRLRSNDDSLTNLNLNIRRLTPLTLKYLCEALRCNYTLTTLNLVNSLVSHSSSIKLTPLRLGLQYQKHHEGLSVLHLSYNKLVDISELGILLQTNQSLEEVYLNYNHVGASVKVVANALCHANTTLKVLHLGTNRIDNRGAHALANMLKFNTTLTFLSLIGNQIDHDGIVALVGALEHSNVTLESLELERNPGSSSKLLQHAKQWSLANQYGRYLLQEQDIPDGLWPHVLNTKKREHDDANRIYFFLQSKPDLMVQRRRPADDTPTAMDWIV